MELRELKPEFKGKGEVRGFMFTQIKRTKNGYIYKVERSGYPTMYEVFKRRINKQFNCVSYPKSKSFGIWAWCCRSVEEAEIKLLEFETQNK